MSIAESLEEIRLAPAGSLLLPDMAGFARVAAESGHSVLITGETGCGKTHLARLIHESGPRSKQPFVRVNCAAIPDALFEREMFGHVKGAYTDARDAAAGFLEAANRGTLFLDEVAELAPQNQPKLLAVLEDGCFRKLGSPVETRADVQVITAANRDLPEMVGLKQFRQDLFYRISVLRYTVVPLRERRGEIPALVEQLLEKNRRPGTSRPHVSREALAVLRRHTWPGNIRELENVLRAAAAFAVGGEIGPEHLPAEVVSPSDAFALSSTFARPAERYSAPTEPDRELEMIRQALNGAGGNKTVAARALGMSRSTLWAKLQRYG
ncbi:MAG TPA: sigma 54-interacting transcriptional regulator [Longimicrobium sp.]|jgi:DNA-binding NtrC family response regulator|uniref:sigma 54-interacting transcriptional regulator n=1 Tax=Longimicrobium sp. TaxID=2029185 RepID=UPI002ED8F594